MEEFFSLTLTLVQEPVTMKSVKDVKKSFSSWPFTACMVDL